MLVPEDKILALLPQRPPMVMVDGLVSCDEKITVSLFTIKKGNIFLNENGFTASGMMETIAQTSAARIGFLLNKNSDGVNKRPPVGVIGSIKNFRLYFQPVSGSVITTTIEVAHEVLQATIIKGKVEVNGTVAAECDMQIFLTEEQSGS